MRNRTDSAQRHRTSTAAPVGRLLAGAVVVGSTPPGRVLAASVAGEPEGHEVVERAEGIGGVPARRSRQRVSVPP